MRRLRWWLLCLGGTGGFAEEAPIGCCVLFARSAGVEPAVTDEKGYVAMTSRPPLRCQAASPRFLLLHEGRKGSDSAGGTEHAAGGEDDDGCVVVELIGVLFAQLVFDCP